MQWIRIDEEDFCSRAKGHNGLNSTKSINESMSRQ